LISTQNLIKNIIQIGKNMSNKINIEPKNELNKINTRPTSIFKSIDVKNISQNFFSDTGIKSYEFDIRYETTNPIKNIEELELNIVNDYFRKKYGNFFKNLDISEMVKLYPEFFFE